MPDKRFGRRSPYVTVECSRPGCGTTVERRASEVRGKVYCSRECYRGYNIPGPGRPRSRMGERKVDKHGYVWLYIGPEAARDEFGGYKRGWVPEHRVVMQRHLGRPLLPTEQVHHRKGGRAGRSNNALSNLELWTTHHPKGHRVEDVVEYAREMLGLYGTQAERDTYTVPPAG